jgi:hypothetical protein
MSDYGYGSVQWQYREEESLKSNIEDLAQSLDMFSRLLEDFGASSLGAKEIAIHPYTFVFLGEVARSMANEALKMVSYSA